MAGAAHQQTAAVLRLQSDLKAIKTEPPDGCSASPHSDDNLFVWSATIFGPDETAWEGSCALCLPRAPLDVSRAPGHHSRRDASLTIARHFCHLENAQPASAAPRTPSSLTQTATTRRGAVKISTRLESPDATWVLQAVRFYFPHANLPTSPLQAASSPCA